MSYIYDVVLSDDQRTKVLPNLETLNDALKAIAFELGLDVPDVTALLAKSKSNDTFFGAATFLVDDEIQVQIIPCLDLM